MVLYRNKKRIEEEEKTNVCIVVLSDHSFEKCPLKNKNKRTTSSHLSNPKPNTSPRPKISDQPDVKHLIFEFNYNASYISTKT